MRSDVSYQIVPLADCHAAIPELAVLWYEGISKQWVPGASIERAKKQLLEHANLNQLPLTLVALQDDKPIGMASLRVNDGIREDLAPWLGSLVVAPAYQKSGVGKQLIEAIKHKAKELGFTELFLLAFDRTIPQWYGRLGWNSIGVDQLFEHPVAVMSTPLT